MAQRIGAFELGEEIGAGGMGRVYRARDPRLGRDVAIKVLADELRGDAERRRRFEIEARAIAALTHPNVMAIHDVGSDDGVPYLVCELLDGETLRERLDGGPLAWRKAVELARQIAAGLAAVHAAGIVHRDLKPSNVFVTRDGRVKLLDFGVARARAKVPDGDSTIEGAVIGTAGYMAPEQVRGEAADARADIFALGAVLHELLAGTKAFDGATDVERGYAVLKTEPADLPSTVPAPLVRIVRRCLEKRRDERFESARDLGFALEALLETSATSPTTTRARPRRRTWLVASAVGLALVGVASVVVWLRSPSAPTKSVASTKRPTFQAVTFRRGLVDSARFTTDGASIVYGAIWDAERYATYLAIPGRPDARTLHAEGAALASLSSTGELLLRQRDNDRWSPGSLARASLAGGALRPILDHVVAADWIPGSDEIAVVRTVGQYGTNARFVLEFPAGRPALDRDEPMDYVRVSRDGTRAALVVRDNARWNVVVVDRRGTATNLVSQWSEIAGLAWSPDGREVWFTGRASKRDEGTRALHAVDLQGQVRDLLEEPGSVLTLHDVAPDGRALLSRDHEYHRMIGRRATEGIERELSWFDLPSVSDISSSGELVLFNELGVAAHDANDGLAYLRRLDGSPPIKLIDTWGEALSADGTRALILTVTPDNQEHLSIIPTGAGTEKQVLPRGPIEIYKAGAFFPGGDRVALLGIGPAPQREWRVYVQAVSTATPAEPRAVTPPGTVFPSHANPVSVDGKWLFAADAKTGTLRLYSIDGGDPRAPVGIDAKDVPLRWSNDGRIFVVRFTGPEARIVAIDPATGASEKIHELAPSDRAGVNRIRTVVLTPDGKSYVYSYTQRLARLFIVEGLR